MSIMFHDYSSNAKIATKIAWKPMLQARYKNGAAMLGRIFYVAGGKSGIYKNLSSVEIYHALVPKRITGTWNKTSAKWFFFWLR